MANRITVMSRLEGLTQDDWRMFHSDSEVQEIARSALAMLKEQEAVEPIIKQEMDDVCSCIDAVAYCGKCGAYIGRLKQNYCHECGKAVKWD